MPTYEYQCKNCNHGFEVFQSMSEAPLTECPQCGSEIRRIINGGGGVIFKGSGFYVTDKGKPRAAPARQEGKPAADGKGAGEGKPAADGKSAGEGKPAADGKSVSAASAACSSCPASSPGSEKAAG
ncbi:MAG: zinc ribbon domain-containing protein [Spirochaetaceae bacterium]|jgi:putative FmdB family regulatory protein|nr:zinc ribbon domain-containing protein [Spirochaetaceae bacterium]